MVSLATSYLGLPLASPLVVSANPLCRHVNNIVEMEAAGAGAVVLPTYFAGSDRAATMKFAAYERLIDEASRRVDIPIIASLNAKTDSDWERYARWLNDTPMSALELNIYHLPTGIEADAAEIEAAYATTVKAVCAVVSQPVAVKLHPYFTALAHTARRLAAAGADGLVLFNRFYEPNYDLASRVLAPKVSLTDSMALSLRLRWMGMLYGAVDVDWAISGGVHSGQDAVKALMAGADVVMVASVLLRHGVGSLTTIREEMSLWMETEGYYAVDDVVGRIATLFSNVSSSLLNADADIDGIADLPAAH